jgi:hypothetical protein
VRGVACLRDKEGCTGSRVEQQTQSGDGSEQRVPSTKHQAQPACSDADDDQQMRTLRRAMLLMDATPLEGIYLFRPVHNYDGITCRPGAPRRWLCGGDQAEHGHHSARLRGRGDGDGDGRWGDPPAMKRPEGRNLALGPRANRAAPLTSDGRALSDHGTEGVRFVWRHGQGRARHGMA